MFKADIVNRMERTGAMAVVRVESLERGFEVAQGCLDGGIDVLEISYTTPNAGEIITELKKRFGDTLLVGAGTILDSETARIAILAGAEFIFAPNLSEEVAVLSNRYQIPYVPGCTSITEVVRALELGASYIKAFPISNFYGPSLGKVFSTPLPNLPLLGSGGATIENIPEWINNNVHVIGFGGLLTSGTQEEITNNARLIKEKIDKTRAERQ